MDTTFLFDPDQPQRVSSDLFLNGPYHEKSTFIICKRSSEIMKKSHSSSKFHEKHQLPKPRAFSKVWLNWQPSSRCWIFAGSCTIGTFFWPFGTKKFRDTKSCCKPWEFRVTDGSSHWELIFQEGSSIMVSPWFPHLSLVCIPGLLYPYPISLYIIYSIPSIQILYHSVIAYHYPTI
jgi:hypothetical protein